MPSVTFRKNFCDIWAGNLFWTIIEVGQVYNLYRYACGAGTGTHICLQGNPLRKLATATDPDEVVEIDPAALTLST